MYATVLGRLTDCRIARNAIRARGTATARVRYKGADDTTYGTYRLVKKCIANNSKNGLLFAEESGGNVVTKAERVLRNRFTRGLYLLASIVPEGDLDKGETIGRL